MKSLGLEAIEQWEASMANGHQNREDFTPEVARDIAAMKAAAQVQADGADDLNLRTQERDGAMRAAVREYARANAAEAALTEWKNIASTNGANGLEATIRLAAEQAKGQAHEQRVLALREWLERNEGNGKRTADELLLLLVVKAKMDDLGFAPAPVYPRCDHKFIDSAHCLKCGWTPTPCPDCDTGFPEGRTCSTCHGIAYLPAPPAGRERDR